MVAGYGSKVLIRNLSFSIPSPAFIAVIGHNGAGKSTLFKAFLQKVDYQGQLLVQGKDLKQLSNPAEQGLLSYLPQKSTVTFPIKVRDLVVMGLFRKKRFFENYSTTDYKQADQTLEELQLAHLTHQDFTTLSGGEQQLVWLAQLMLQDANINLLDEPTQQLDVYYKNKVFGLLQSWVTQYGKTVLCITHDLNNLTPMQGYLLNLSKSNPTLEPITPETVQQNQAFLEAGRQPVV
ncbi:iron complex transport system ATP-binding protein [Pontibacter ummariensis]|uniref:Iron complex transport system ATP-binding protein n=1 Tax=Pontibacter ummariensis TaxID=1610492 RepID=A0A239GYB8_9BACT|nr:iron complex transport system ATP-binding protein [Pontibacter ummariensis]SNS74196.1 iron complex transport system ATP-binding protein [Pontibacter ummariensis]